MFRLCMIGGGSFLALLVVNFLYAQIYSLAESKTQGIPAVGWAEPQYGWVAGYIATQTLFLAHPDGTVCLWDLEATRGKGKTLILGGIRNAQGWHLFGEVYPVTGFPREASMWISGRPGGNQLRVVKFHPPGGHSEILTTAPVDEYRILVAGKIEFPLAHSSIMIPAQAVRPSGYVALVDLRSEEPVFQEFAVIPVSQIPGNLSPAEKSVAPGLWRILRTAVSENAFLLIGDYALEWAPTGFPARMTPWIGVGSGILPEGKIQGSWLIFRNEPETSPNEPDPRKPNLLPVGGFFLEDRAIVLLSSGSELWILRAPLSAWLSSSPKILKNHMQVTRISLEEGMVIHRVAGIHRRSIQSETRPVLYLSGEWVQNARMKALFLELPLGMEGAPEHVRWFVIEIGNAASGFFIQSGSERGIVAVGTSISGTGDPVIWWTPLEEACASEMLTHTEIASPAEFPFQIQHLPVRLQPVSRTIYGDDRIPVTPSSARSLVRTLSPCEESRK